MEEREVGSRDEGEVGGQAAQGRLRLSYRHVRWAAHREVVIRHVTPFGMRRPRPPSARDELETCMSTGKRAVSRNFDMLQGLLGTIAPCQVPPEVHTG